MQFEFNVNVCKSNAYEIQTIEYRIRLQLTKLTEVYGYYKISEDMAERELARKMHKEIVRLEQEIRDISVMRKSLEKLTTIYESTEKQLAQMTEGKAARFIIRPIPAPLKPIYLNKLISNVKLELY